MVQKNPKKVNTSKKPNNPRSRGYCFTVNNYDDDDIAFVMSLYEEDITCSYLVVGFEKAPRTDTPHLQCYIYYSNTVALSAMKKRLYPHHVEVQKAKKNVNAYVYCLEGGCYYEMGEAPRQGYRTDLEHIRILIKDGTPLSTIRDKFFNQWVYHRKVFNEYHDDLPKRCRLIKLEENDEESMIKAARILASSNYRSVHVKPFVYEMIDVMTMYYSNKYHYIFYDEKNLFGDQKRWFKDHAQDFDDDLY